jgi:hypothetical protein
VDQEFPQIKSIAFNVGANCYGQRLNTVVKLVEQRFHQTKDIALNAVVNLVGLEIYTFSFLSLT